MPNFIEADSWIYPQKDQIHCDLDEEKALLNLRNGVYYGLNSVGSRVWDLIQQPRTFREIVRTLFSEYDVNERVCENDLRALLDRMAEEGLIAISNEPPR